VNIFQVPIQSYYDENLLKEMITLRNIYDTKKAEEDEKNKKESVPKADHVPRMGRKHARRPRKRR
jgi:hypothetical protein